MWVWEQGSENLCTEPSGYDLMPDANVVIADNRGEVSQRPPLQQADPVDRASPQAGRRRRRLSRRGRRGKEDRQHKRERRE